MLRFLFLSIFPFAIRPINVPLYNRAVDFSVLPSASDLVCLKNNYINVIIVRCYNPENGGSFDSDCVFTIRNATNLNMGIEIYATPQPYSSKSGAQQFYEMYNGLTSNGIIVRSLWLQIVSPVNWRPDFEYNVNFISSYINASFSKGVNVGIYTTNFEWSQIANYWTGYPVDRTNLWYWNVNTGGVNGETLPKFYDFKAFGAWNFPTVKQYGQNEISCGIVANKNVYVKPGMAIGRTSQGPVVGGNFD